MAEIKMSYIFLEKEKHESKTIQKIIIEIIDNTVDKREEKNLIVDNTKIKYRIIQKENSNRWLFRDGCERKSKLFYCQH